MSSQQVNASDGGRLELIAVADIPLLRAGDNLAKLLGDSMAAGGCPPRSGDVLVVAQKVVSKAESRYVDLAGVTPSPDAVNLSRAAVKDPRLIEVILRESRQVLRVRPGLLIVEHRLGHIMANAGIDQSNLEGNADGERVLLLPQDPDASCAVLKHAIDKRFETDVAVIINDSVGRAWRTGIVGIALGLAGVPATKDMRGDEDLYGRTLQVTQTGFADAIAGAASLLMGEGAQALPLVIVRGLCWSGPGTGSASLLRDPAQDLFR